MPTIAKLPYHLPLCGYQGDDDIISFRIKIPTTGEYWDMTGVTGRCQVKEEEDRDSDLVVEYEFISGPEDLLIGRAIFFASNADMSAAEPGEWWYDLELTANGKIKTFYRGPYTLKPEITTEEGYVPPPS